MKMLAARLVLSTRLMGVLPSLDLRIHAGEVQETSTREVMRA